MPKAIAIFNCNECVYHTRCSFKSADSSAIPDNCPLPCSTLQLDNELLRAVIAINLNNKETLEKE